MRCRAERSLSGAQASREPADGRHRGASARGARSLGGEPAAQVGAPPSRGSFPSGALVPPERTIEAGPGACWRHAAGTAPVDEQARAFPTRHRPSDDQATSTFVGPRRLHGGVRFHALNQIDAASHHAGLPRRAQVHPVRQRRPVRLADRDRRDRPGLRPVKL